MFKKLIAFEACDHFLYFHNLDVSRVILKGELDASHYRGQRVTHCTKGFLFGFYFMFVFFWGGIFFVFVWLYMRVLDLKLSVMLFFVFSLIWFLFSKRNS